MIRILMITTIAALSFGLGSAAHAEMMLTSSDLTNGHAMPKAQVFNSFGCTGDNLSPQLAWSGVPNEAKSLALTVYDPDAPTGSGWWHWVAFNLPTTVHELPTNASKEAMPDGAVQSLTDFGSAGYGGACPPAGDAPHHYIFTLYALDTPSLPLDENASGAMVGYYLNQHKIDAAQLTVTYGRGIE